ncbi:low specificity L-threonine aldolase [Rhizobium sp. CFBP 8762]|uniref:threonine aldolase family protein n=1 Tax=Rhizobium sp. CFBP 8762 TaxID=2775279 RepID=UPI00178075C5|nr:low specificity L-threonine aldolase [Rhizobium sp. CFBP 8762]MBD8556267.1 low specificity L-threonine aldolase [Rhizobium sp. CFBP 8762]
MIFASDNWAGAHPAISKSLSEAASGFASAYGTSELDRQVEQSFAKIFERDVSVFFVGTGTAANSLALASYNRPGGHVFCHREAHINVDECGAPEFFSHGARLAPVDGTNGKMDPALLDTEIRRFSPDFVHGGQPMAVSMTQATEVGSLYTLNEIDEIAAVARAHNLPLHMDGARFANALVALDTTPAEMTWKRGVDVLSFGGTKNGCWCAEALVLFDPARATEMHYLRKRSAQLFSKSRFIAAQFEAYLQDDLWLSLARNANTMAARLASGLSGSDTARLAWQPEGNEVFAIIRKQAAQTLRDKGAVFYDWHVPAALAGQVADDEVMIRLVTSFATIEADVDGFLAHC